MRSISLRHSGASAGLDRISDSSAQLRTSSILASPGKRRPINSRPEIPLADLDAVVAQRAVGDGGVEVELRKRSWRNYGPSSSWSCRTHRKVTSWSRRSNWAGRRRRSRWSWPAARIIPQRLFGVGCRRHLLCVRQAQPQIQNRWRLDLSTAAACRIEPRTEQHLGRDFLAVQCASALVSRPEGWRGFADRPERRHTDM
jgi:hypothetical protein